MQIRLKRLTYALFLVALTQKTHAARPFVTDDARLTTAESCQLESWTRSYKNSNEFWALPACNLTGNFEITAGGGKAKSNDSITTNDFVVQGKTLFKELNTNSWGWGLAFGRVNHPQSDPGPNQLGNSYAYIPASVSLMDDKVIVHMNMGRLKDKATQESRTTWGIGTEINTSKSLLLIAESFGDSKSNPFVQIGARYSVIPNIFQIDTTLGKQVNGSIETRWISFGLRFTPEKIF
jgi:hypothetical protein